MYKEVKTVTTDTEVNKLLSSGWKLIDSKVEKVRVPKEKICVGKDYGGDWYNGLYSTPRYEIPYEELLSSLYILGLPEMSQK